MKKLFTTAINLAVAGMMLQATGWSQQPAPANSQKTSTTSAQSATASNSSQVLTTQKDKISYALGMNMGVNLHRQSIDIDPAILEQGLKDGIGGNKQITGQ